MEKLQRNCPKSNDHAERKTELKNTGMDEAKMKAKLITYFLKMTPLTAEEIEVLTASMSIKTFSKGSYLAKEGHVGSDTFFVLQGCIRKFKLVDGNDITLNFYTEEQWIISLENFAAKTPIDYQLICLENVVVVIGNEQKATELFAQHPRFETISRQVMEAVFFEQHQQMTSYITDKPEQRYLKLLATRPDIFQRAPQYDIASYIGVKPETLSRIRKKIHTKAN